MKQVPQKNNYSPVHDIQTIIDENDQPYVNRIMIGTPVTGLVRIEWVGARYGQIIPMNWSYLYVNQFISSYMPLRYQVADAQNLIVKHAIKKEMEWLFLLEHDVIIPPDTFMRINDYMLKADVPIVSGLYFCRGRPSYPLVFRGRGNSVYASFELGDEVWVDGVPTGCLLIHMSLLREMWQNSEEYQVANQTTRRIFKSPRDLWFDPENMSGDVASYGGTSDLDWCTRIMEGKYFEKAGWKDYIDKKYPFLIDTNIFCKHINPDGEQFP